MNRTPLHRLACLAMFAITPSPAAETQPAAPAELPGKGLAHHDFFYAGEAKTQDMYLVKAGKVAWAFHNPGSKGEISDAIRLSNGNVLFAHQYGVTLIDSTRKVLWKRDAPEKCEIHTAMPIGKERVLYLLNGPEPKIVIANLTTDTTEKELPLAVGNPKGTHGQFRHARLTDQGTLLVAHMDNGKVAEYDETGKEVWSVKFPSPWAASRLANGNTLVSATKLVREVNPVGETMWEVTPADVPDYLIKGFQIATRLPNGNTLVNNWVNPWSETVDPHNPPVQALEITPAKKVVWALRSWEEPANLGPATTIQLLDPPGIPEDARFGSIK